MKSDVQRDLHTPVIVAILFTITKKRNQAKYSQSNEEARKSVVLLYSGTLFSREKCEIDSQVLTCLYWLNL